MRRSASSRRERQSPSRSKARTGWNCDADTGSKRNPDPNRDPDGYPDANCHSYRNATATAPATATATAQPTATPTATPTPTATADSAPRQHHSDPNADAAPTPTPIRRPRPSTSQLGCEFSPEIMLASAGSSLQERPQTCPAPRHWTFAEPIRASPTCWLIRCWNCTVRAALSRSRNDNWRDDPRRRPRSWPPASRRPIISKPRSMRP